MKEKNVATIPGKKMITQSSRATMATWLLLPGSVRNEEHRRQGGEEASSARGSKRTTGLVTHMPVGLVKYVTVGLVPYISEQVL